VHLHSAMNCARRLVSKNNETFGHSTARGGFRFFIEDATSNLG
jgi:hypothetical protein